MILKLKIKPFVVVRDNKNAYRPSDTLYTFSNISSGAYTNENYVYGINYEKHRRKVVRTNTKYQSEHGNVNVSKQINPMFWRMYVYAIPKELLNVFKMKVVQNSRNFKIVRQ